MKIIPYLIIGFLIFSSFTFIGIGKETTQNTLSLNIQFSEPIKQESQEFISLDVKGADTCLYHAGKPILPMFTKKFSFSFGTQIKNVEFEISEISNMALAKKIKPAPQPAIPNKDNSIADNWIDKNIYSSKELFPNNWISYSTGAGLDENKDKKMFLTIQVFPVRYIPTYDIIYYIENLDLTITYEEPENIIFPETSEYSLLILTSTRFSNNLEILLEHKESKGINSILVTLDEIYNGDYFPVEGRDDPEKIKYFIKDAIEQWGIEYVMLVGGRIPGLTEKWYFPVRYVNVFWANESSYISDLYYADIYNGDGDFSSWDTNNNGVYGEWPNSGSLIDDMDLYPDVNVGRLPCRFKFELNIMVKKIISYENSQISKKIVLAGGDNFDDIPYGGNNELEGELVCNKTLEYLPDFEEKKVYGSETDITPRNIRKALGTGGIFMHLHGHGNPLKWSSHKPLNFDEWEEGLFMLDVPFFFNKEYPIVVIGGCHTSMFNISMTIFSWGGPSFRGLSDWLLVKFRGGAIATLGYTCFPVASPGENGDLDGDGINEPDCVESGYGYMQLRLFYAYGEKDQQYLGDCWNFAVSNYTDHFKHPYAQWHIHTIHGFVLLGDPSLKIGGYKK
ncbi:MAG: hypothetical protein JSU91_03070 [Thermoplasmatales archaeon]|nr:MAG: hypothetical protein JSU91_03070 [Thermoplasmatales archaeon]